MDKLINLSIKKIHEAQSEYGSYIASPAFSTYAFCWFRDSAFIAHAMNLAGEFDSAKRFHDWATDVILRNEDLIDSSLIITPSEATEKGLYIKARYRIDGLPDISDHFSDHWPNFQLDGPGTWLWSLEKFVSKTQTHLSVNQRRAVLKVAQYLEHFWQSPCYDYWEEKPDSVHSSTLASIAAGLRAAETLIGFDAAKTLNDIYSFLDKNLLEKDVIQKCTNSNGLDASTLCYIVPFGDLQIGNFNKHEQWQEINSKLSLSGGLVRYLGDTYYGGGEWILLTAWSAWAAKELGLESESENLLRWVESKFDPDGNLPEQSLEAVQDRDFIQEWIDRWGEPANPLTWSYAMYLIARLN